MLIKQLSHELECVTWAAGCWAWPPCTEGCVCGRGRGLQEEAGQFQGSAGGEVRTSLAVGVRVHLAHQEASFVDRRTRLGGHAH